jgi:hypothetical protein
MKLGELALAGAIVLIAAMTAIFGDPAAVPFNHFR